MTTVYDVDGRERDLEWLAREYDGCTVLRAPVAVDDSEVWRLEAILVTEGPAVLKVETRRGTEPALQQNVALTWPSLETPSQDLERLPAARSMWTERGVIGRTGTDGIYGAGLGRSFGPFYHAWVMSSAPSDCLTKAGMKGGTNHRGPLHGVWVLTPVAPAYATLTEALLQEGERAQVIQFNPMAALQLRIFAAGFVPNSPEFQVIFNGQAYAAQRAEHLGTGEVRIYFCRMGDWGNVTYVTRRKWLTQVM